MKKDAQEKFQTQYEDVIEAEMELQSDWGNDDARENLDAAQMELHQMRQNKMEVKYDRILSSWTRTGDRCNKEFFEYHTGFRKPTAIKELHDGTNIIKETAALQAYADTFYKTLYTREATVEDNDSARQ